MSVITDNPAVITDQGRSVTGTGIPPGAFVGTVTDTPATATAPAQSGGLADTGSFTLVDAHGQPLSTTAAVSGVTLGARTPATDPLFDATDATTGGGDTGSVLISPFIKPGTVSNVFYNHYSWLRTMEDLFSVGRHSPGWTSRGTSASPRNWAWPRSALTCSPTRPDSTPAGENGICHAPREPGRPGLAPAARVSGRPRPHLASRWWPWPGSPPSW